MTPKKLLSLTDRNIQSIRIAARKTAEAIGGRFGDIDNTMVGLASELCEIVDAWADRAERYSEESFKEGFWDEQRFEGLGL